MSDVQTNKLVMSVACKLVRDNESSSRTFSVQNVIDPSDSPEAEAQFRLAAQNLASFLTGRGSTLIQPSGWRDDDTSEAEWTTTSVEITTTNSLETKWDLRKQRNVTFEFNGVSVTTLSASSIGSDMIDNLFYISDQNDSALEEFKFAFETNEDISRTNKIYYHFNNNNLLYLGRTDTVLSGSATTSITAYTEGDATYLPSATTLVIAGEQ